MKEAILLAHFSILLPMLPFSLWKMESNWTFFFFKEKLGERWLC